MSLPPGVILAGGLATRMGGGDKGLLEVGGRTLLSRVLERLAPQVSSIALNANGDPDRFGALGMESALAGDGRQSLPVLQDPVAGRAGPLAGVLAGLDWAADLGERVVVTVAADTPFFPVDLVSRLLEASAGMDRPLALAASRARDGDGDCNGAGSGSGRPRRHPTFGIWPVSLRADLRSALSEGVRKVVAWTDRHGCQEAVFAFEREDPFFNVNTPEDLERAERIAALQSGANGAGSGGERHSDPGNRGLG